MDETTLSVEGERRLGEVKAKRGRLRVVYPFALETEVEVGAKLIVGRRPDAGSDQLAIIHPTVSRQHAVFTRDASGDFAIEDLGSHNGSWVDGVSMTGGKRVLASGAILRFGEVLLAFETFEEGAPEPRDQPALWDALPGASVAMRHLRREVLRAAPTTATALITGETGTGKERVAHELHRLSGRTGDFVAFNTAEVSAELFANTLFGHEAGAFTGAEGANLGIVRSAEGGTLLLDEIGELEPTKQVALLRLLEERELRPLGRSAPIKVDVRFVAATNRDLRAEVEAGRFRRDLYARLALVPISVPALSSRRMDIAEWIARFDGLGGREANTSFTAEAIEAALLHAYPENLRGISRLVEAARMRDASSPFGRQDVVEVLKSATPAAAIEKAPRAAFLPAPSKAELEELLARLGSVRAVAKHFGRDRRQIYRWLEAYGMSRS